MLQMLTDRQLKIVGRNYNRIIRHRYFVILHLQFFDYFVLCNCDCFVFAPQQLHRICQFSHAFRMARVSNAVYLVTCELSTQPRVPSHTLQSFPLCTLSPHSPIRIFLVHGASRTCKPVLPPCSLFLTFCRVRGAHTALFPVSLISSISHGCCCRNRDIC